MILRKLFYATAAVIAAFCWSDTARAQQTVGEWNLFPLFDSSITNVIDTDSKVFYLSANRLYSYDKDSDETYVYSTRNVLNDTEIFNIYHNPEGGYLLIAYTTGNIDLLYTDTGRVVNLSDISAATLTSTKSIRDVAFGKGRIYVGTDFGLVIFDDTRHHVEQSGIYNRHVDGVAVAGDRVVLAIPQSNDSGASYDFYTIKTGERINSLDKFVKSTPQFTNCTGLTGFDNCVWVNSYNHLRRLNINEDGTLGTPTQLNLYPRHNPQYLSDGNLLLQVGNVASGTITSSTLKTFDSTGAELSSTALPEALVQQMVSSADPAKALWAADGDGLASYSLAGDGTLTVLSDKSRPEASSVTRVAYLTPSKNGERIYVSNIGCSLYRSVNPTMDDYGMQRTDVIVNGKISDVAPAVVEHDQNDCKSWQRNARSTRMFGGTGRLAVDPVNPDRYYISNNVDGVFVIENGEVIGRFTVKNMPIYCFWGGNKNGGMGYNVAFDPKGNLWVGFWIYDADYSKFSPYCVLPAEKLRGDLSAITKDDWQISAHRSIDAGNKDMGAIFSSKSNMFFTWHGAENNPLGAYDTKGTYTNTSDDKYIELDNTYDQDGHLFKPLRWVCAAEDKRGRLWFGTTSGVVEITNPERCMDANFTYTRLKVPRNDGTPYADYLLESDQINCISVDASNRKWIATENSGVYLVSENGDAILEHFTTENSDLTSNAVQSVYADPHSNVVYFGLANGLMSYNSTSAPAAEDYSDVYAYPNPVRPDYTGWITIKGLMDNSLVKIADIKGNVFYQTRSEGGMVVWDGCNADGQRVKSGVYLVFASQNENDNASGAVTKIMVIN